MNNEYNNNEQNDYLNGNQYPNNNVDHNLKQDNQQNYNNGNYAGNYNSNYNQNQNQNQNYQQPNMDPSMIYPTTQVMQGKKPKKKGRVLGVFKLTASAVAFGLIAGLVFQGYYFSTVPEAGNTTEDNNLQIAEVTQDTTGKDTIIPTSSTADSIVTDVSEVVANVMPSIVAINSSATVTYNDFFGREYSEPSQGSGSGIIIGQNGSEILIVTNNHVIEGANSIEIVFSDETTASAIVKGTDANADLAVLSVNLEDLAEKTASSIKVATLGNSDELKAGEMAIAIGNALGYGQSVTVGYISAVNREVTIGDQTMTLLQTDAAINPGNSGGALINSSGQVIGINSVKFASEEVEGMGYAIPITNAIPMINELMNREVIAESEKGFLGIDTATAQEVTELYAARFNMPIGVYVNDVVAGSPAETAGLIQGDIITGVNDLKVETIEDLINALSYKKVGDKISLIIQEKANGAYVEKTLEVTLGKRQ
jgi:serine protease Do